MKNLLLTGLFLFLFLLGMAQNSVKDSLVSFNVSKAVIEAHEKGLEGSELKVFVKMAERNYLKKKFNIPQQVNPVASSVKYSSINFITNLPCYNEDFELSPTGAITSSATGWSAAEGVYGISVICPTSTLALTNNTSAVVIYNTPITDANCNNVANSPFGGNKVVKINDNGYAVGRIRQTFPVTSSNWIYNYAYKGVLSQLSGHLCCEEPTIMFRFYDCTNNLISSISQTLVPNTATCVTTSTLAWASGTTGYIYTPNWVVLTENLFPYIGTCVTVEVLASVCIYGGHQGYCYYDAKCSGGAIIANGQTFSSPITTFTSCASTATLSGLPGFTSYQWQGPSGSGVSGSTNSLITTTVPGNYTLTAISNSVTMTQTLSVAINSVGSNVSIAGSNTMCTGGALVLQVSGGSFTSYTWTTYSNAQAIYISPSVTTVYGLTATNLFGCISTDSKTVSILQSPTVGIIGSSSPICPGQNVNLFASASPVNSYAWSSGPTVPNITVSPTVTTIYTTSVMAANGCYAYASRTITVLTSPNLQLGLSSPTICAGRSVVLSAYTTGTNTFQWSTGSTAQNISVVPVVNTAYSVTATNVSGCAQSASKTVTVYPLPQIQMISSGSGVCSGQPVNFGVIGSNIGSVLWSNGAASSSISVNPTLNSVYSVTVTSPAGCKASDSKTITVYALPQIQVTASSVSICLGGNTNITANGTGIISYTWNTGQGSQYINVSPVVTTQYTITGTDNHGCAGTANIMIQVVSCTDTLATGIEKYAGGINGITVFPNPSNDSFIIQGYKNETGQLVNELGQVIREFNLSAGNNFALTISNLAKGVYVVRVRGGSSKVIVK